MPKQKITKTQKNDSLRYLTVHLDKNRRLKGAFQISPSLKDAQAAKPTEEKEPNEQKQKTESANTFAVLQNDLIEKIAVHRSLDNIMILLQYVNMDIQFDFSVGPILKKHGALIQESKDRKIYSFDRQHAREVISSLRKADSGVQGVAQLPRLVLIGLVGEYDVFLHDLIRAGLSAQKNAAASINRNLTLQELLTFSNIDEATNYLIEREIDSILHDDHHDQLLAISKLFNIKIDTGDKCVKDFLEICERRNLFTHNAGIVNSRYLGKCSQFKIESKCKLGDSLKVDHKYFQNAIITTQELGIKLIQFVWRKLVPAEHEQADSALNQAAYELLVSDDYNLAERILDYGINHTGTKSDLLRRMMVVNYANAIKLGGDKKRAESELAKYDWSATNSAFQISVSAVRNNLKEVVSTLPHAVKSGEINEDDLRNWPVFKTMRGEKEFQDCFKNIFHKDLISAAALTNKAADLVPKVITAKTEQAIEKASSPRKPKTTHH